MLLIKSILLLIFFLKISVSYSFETSTNLQQWEPIYFSDIETIQITDFKDVLNSKNNNAKHFILYHEKLDPNLDSYLELKFPKSTSHFRFNKDVIVDRCETSNLIALGDIKEGTFLDEILLRSYFTDLKVFYKIKDNIILKTKSKNLRQYNAFNLYIRDTNLKPFIQFINLIENSKTNLVSNLLHGIQNLPNKVIDGKNYYVVNVNILNLGRDYAFKNDHFNTFIDLSFLPLINNIDYIEFFKDDCIYPISFNDTYSYYVYYQKNREEVIDINCKNCKYKIYLLNYNKSSLDSSFEISSRLYFEEFLRNNDNDYYQKIINENYYSNFLKNYTDKYVVAKNNIYENILIEDIIVLNQNQFIVNYDDNKILFELENLPKIKDKNNIYFYFENKFIRYTDFINKYLCSYYFFSYEEDYEIIDKLTIDNDFFNLPVNNSSINNNILNCSYNLKYKDYPNLMKKFNVSSFYFQNNHFLDNNFIIFINDNKNLIKLLNSKNYSLISKNRKFFLLNIAIIFSDILMILMIIFLYRKKLFKINKLFFLSSIFIIFILILTHPDSEHLIASYLLYYSSVYLLFISLFVTILSLRKSKESFL